MVLHDPHYEVSGCINQHFEAVFSDGARWLVRVPAGRPRALPKDMTKYMLDSEAATYQTLRQVGLPVAEVHAWGCDLSRSDGEYPKQPYLVCPSDLADHRTTYMIYSEMPGTTGEDLDIEGIPSDEHTASLVRSYAEHHVKLSKAPFRGIGSPCLRQGDSQPYSAGPFIPLSAFVRPDASHFEGPFRTMRDYYMARIDTILHLILRGLIYREMPLLFYLLHLEVKSMVSLSEELDREVRECFIRHPDAAGRNLLVESGTITAYVDWEL